LRDQLSNHDGHGNSRVFCARCSIHAWLRQRHLAVAVPQSTLNWSVAGEFKVKVEVRDTLSDRVFQALIAMWVSPKKPAT
jgi:hypothetical protein